MKTNEELQKDVQNAIEWEPLLNAAEIGVTAKNAVVTLTGAVNSYSKKLEAEHATKNVAGVNAVVEKIEVVVPNALRQTDNEIATEVLTALKWNWEVPKDKIKVTVEKGLVTLEGELKSNFEKEAAKKAIKNLMGVTGVINNITIKSESRDALEKREVEAALARHWSINDRNIHVKISGTDVTLTATVASFCQKEEAPKIAWNTPDVWTVHNEPEVEFEYLLVD